ncbi:unnamed protein product, partial [Discosporangium mesarthrocarpum]
RFLNDERVLVAECFAFLWEADASVIVVDIDGTITKSDVTGLLMTLTPGLNDHTHEGICSMLNRISTKVKGAKLVYLTSRPIILAPKTRAFLTSMKQGGQTLPLAPLMCSLEGVTGVLWREVGEK